MGSPLRRLGSTVLIVLAIASACASAASARPTTVDEAGATALAFLNALGNNQPDKLCAMFTARAVAKLGGLEKCTTAFTQEDPTGDPDFAAVDTLSHAWAAAKKSASKRHGDFVTKHFKPLALARAMERLDPEVTVRLGRAPTAAAGQLVTTTILDTRSTGRRLVLYAESDDGSIMRLTASKHGTPTLDEVAQGVPEAPSTKPDKPEFTAAIDSVTIDSAGTASAWGTYAVTYEGETLSARVLILLTPSGTGYQVDDFFYSILG